MIGCDAREVRKDADMMRVRPSERMTESMRCKTETNRGMLGGGIPYKSSSSALSLN